MTRRAQSSLLPLYLVPVRHDLGVDVLAYRTPECVRPVARWHWWADGKPTRRNRRVMFNCYAWRAVWLPERPGEGADR